MAPVRIFVQRLQFTRKGFLRKITALDTKLNNIMAGLMQESVRFLKGVGRSKLLCSGQCIKSPVKVSSSERWWITPTSPRSRRRPSPTSIACSWTSQELSPCSSSSSLSTLFALFSFLNLSARMLRRYYFILMWQLFLLMMRRNNNNGNKNYCWKGRR